MFVFLLLLLSFVNLRAELLGVRLAEITQLHLLIQALLKP
jgi:hypothetical protein